MKLNSRGHRPRIFNRKRIAIRPFQGRIHFLGFRIRGLRPRLLNSSAARTHPIEIDAIPGGFDYSGTGLHYAALNGHGAMIEFLIEHGANVNIKDTKVGSTPAGWAEYGGHLEIKDYLESCP